MNKLSVHETVIAVFNTARLEACALGDHVVYPRYLVAGLLSLLADPQDSSNPEKARIIRDTQLFVGLSQKQAAEALQGLHLALRPMGPAHSTPELPRSRESQHLMARAVELARDAESEMVTSIHLAQAIGEHLPPDQKERWLPGLAPNTREAGAIAGQTPTGTEDESGSQTTEDVEDPSPILKRMGRDLTSLARAGLLAPVVGRQKEIKLIARHLLRTSKRNVLVVGDAGVGKTAVVEGLAYYFASGSAPESLASLRIVQVSLGDVLAGTRYRGDLEERLQALMEEAIHAPDLVLFLDEIHLAAGGGTGHDNPMDVANILKPALARAEFRCIGATTTHEYERFVKKDTAFTRRFQLVRIPEPSHDEAIAICEGWAQRIEKVQHVHFEPDAIRAAVELSSTYLGDRALPDKAIDLLENAATLQMFSTHASQSDVSGSSPGAIDRKQIEAALREQEGVMVEPYVPPAE